MADTADTPESPAAADAYENTAARTALAALQRDPSYGTLAAFLNSLRHGSLVVDVDTPNGAAAADSSPEQHIRTLRTADGQLVLPLFTGVAELRSVAVADSSQEALVLPARDALQLIHSAPFIAVEFDSGSAKQVLLRKFIELVLSDADITEASLAQ